MVTFRYLPLRAFSDIGTGRFVGWDIVATQRDGEAPYSDRDTRLATVSNRKEARAIVSRLNRHVGADNHR